ncbi:carboxypeptidase regulatory-like domain-containing protein [Ornithinimicrobium sp. LYQ121]|uniref:carboxypeptidase regulatory-like domain-containing protein n=1 Tax=Ornithinimicrobium sp. LYQ121 TaxID=3378801 RepID=UPI003854BD7C
MTKDTAAEPLDAQDEEILAALRELYSRADPCPADLVDRVGFALTVRQLHAEVAQLTDQYVPTRGLGTPTEARTISFSTDELGIMLTVTHAGRDRSRLDGWLTWGGAVVQVTSADGSVRETTADDDGRFVLDELPRGQTRLLVSNEGSRPVVTPGFTI